LAERFDTGLLAVVGPEPVEGPFVVGPLVRDGEQQPTFEPAFTWVFWAGPDRRSVRIEMYPDPTDIEGVQLQPLLRSHRHEGPGEPTSFSITIDGAPFDFHGESVGDGVAVQGVVEGTGVELWFFDGWPREVQIVLGWRVGPDLDPLLVQENMWPPDPQTGLRG
jgi:hypothetical protein